MYTDLESLFSSSCLRVYDNLVKALGNLGLAILLSKLIDIDNGQTEEFFFVPIERISRDLCMGEYQQRNAMRKLEKLGLITTLIVGAPPKRHVKLNESAIVKILNSVN